MNQIVFSTLLCICSLILMNFNCSAQDTENFETANSSNTETTIETKYKVGQVWSYKTRSHEKKSTFIVLKVDSNTKYGNIISIALKELKIKNPDNPGGFTNEVNHVPFSEKAIDKSVVALLKEKEDLPDFERGYNLWKEGFDDDQAGYYIFTIAEAVNFLELVFNARKELFLIPYKMKPRWVSIEFDNPSCQPLDNYNEKNVEIKIPEDGFICTSSPSFDGAYQRRYLLVDEKGNRTQLTKSKSVRHESALLKNEPSRDIGQPNCNVRISQFFYGSEDDLRKHGSNSIFQNDTFLTNYHPECRNTGTSFPKRNP